MRIERICVCTVDRQPTYIHQTLATMGLGSAIRCPVHLLVDGPSCSYSSNYDGLIQFHYHEPQESVGRLRAVDNYLRCLRLGAAGGGPCLVVEDDVVFRRGWLEWLEALPVPAEGYWMLSLFSLLGGKPASGYNRFSSPLPGEEGFRGVWAGTYAVVYSPALLASPLASAVANMVREFTDPEGRPLSYDIALGYQAMKAGVAILECSPPQIRHVGLESAMTPGQRWG